MVDIATGLASTPGRRSWTKHVRRIARVRDDRSDVVGLTAACIRIQARCRAIPASGVHSGIAEQRIDQRGRAGSAAGTHPLSRCTRRCTAFDQLLFDRIPVTRDIALVLDRAWGNQALTDPAITVCGIWRCYRARVSDRLCPRDLGYGCTAIATQPRLHHRAFPEAPGASRPEHTISGINLTPPRIGDPTRVLLVQ